MKYFAKIRYLGTDFCGFQVQPECRTVQGELNIAAEKLFGVPCQITGCSRTDSGVHANEFCITIETVDENAPTIPPKSLPRAFSTVLPGDLSLYEAEEISPDFHVRYDAKGKEYVYKIYNAEVTNPFVAKRAWQIQRRITDDGLKKMRAAAEHFIGKHDFCSFMSVNSDVESTERTIFELKIEKNGDEIEIFVSADGFLYNMVRIIVGTLVQVAFGNISADDIPSIIEDKNRARAGMTAPPEGLYLNRVFY